MQLIHPNWPLTDKIHAYTTTRKGGVSQRPFAGLNIGAHVGDVIEDVEANRHLLPQHQHIVWLNQTHSTIVLEISGSSPRVITSPADASISREVGVTCAVMTADCLPILIANPKQQVVAAVHAGWRGLADGIIENTIEKMSIGSKDTYVWLGPAIGANAFEVGAEVRSCFKPQEQNCFTSMPNGKYLADLYQIARSRFNMLNIDNLYGGEFCTFSQPDLFYSYRRDGQTGRMVSCISLL